MTAFFSAYMPYEAAWLLSTVIGVLVLVVLVVDVGHDAFR